jgi:hypothetical protein
MNFRFLSCFLMVLFTAGTALIVSHREGVRHHPHQLKLPEKPPRVSPCELQKDPAAYNHKLIEVTGFISRGFENFTIFDPECKSWPAIWLEYGGTAASGTMYCCGVTAERVRPKPLIIEQIPITLVDDERFRELDKLLQRRPDSVARATIVGRFFSGEEITYPAGTHWGGYGHMGCCTLLAIQQVVSVEPHSSAEFDYGFSPEQPNIGKTGCGYTILNDMLKFESLLKAQRDAEMTQAEWLFTDPQRVATSGLATRLSVAEDSIKLNQTRATQGRFVYEWRPPGKKQVYMIVVSRPYWMSSYAKDAKRVAWVVLAAYESSCGSRNSVTRIR